MKLLLRRDEQIIKEGEAELQLNIVMVVGRLFLTNQRLVFAAHKHNFRAGTTEMELTSIQSIEKCWTKLLGFIPIIPNSLAVYTRQGKTYRFVFFKRSAWITALNSQKNINVA